MFCFVDMCVAMLAANSIVLRVAMRAATLLSARFSQASEASVVGASCLPASCRGKWHKYALSPLCLLTADIDMLSSYCCSRWCSDTSVTRSFTDTAALVSNAYKKQWSKALQQYTDQDQCKVPDKARLGSGDGCGQAGACVGAGAGARPAGGVVAAGGAAGAPAGAGGGGRRGGAGSLATALRRYTTSWIPYAIGRLVIPAGGVQLGNQCMVKREILDDTDEHEDMQEEYKKGEEVAEGQDVRKSLWEAVLKDVKDRVLLGNRSSSSTHGREGGNDGCSSSSSTGSQISSSSNANAVVVSVSTQNRALGIFGPKEEEGHGGVGFKPRFAEQEKGPSGDFGSLANCQLSADSRNGKSGAEREWQGAAAFAAELKRLMVENRSKQNSRGSVS